ncbi:MAG: regulatory protein RecX, regulatory protein [Candidatus Peregrinibacteria bacterium GW2011_GWE2_39_6]|nr:MAG: regulatory protein RecX, regulatory protein [Candidatus Peregrinibacteria bacterium GW2011_GWF2_39_17]KKR25381.1 MAG: regulatory protein RecX, regulatory protein [Candidatus Peregrinibacteria bacterium GW2011_GWE2_39_6]HCW32443.1 hypothetical protein [Candidatus Peregrinibacteria bacterium]
MDHLPKSSAKINPFYQKLMTCALSLLSQRSYSVQRLKEKLTQRLLKLNPRQSDEITIQVINKLVELKYLDDFDFTKRFIEERCRLKPRGKYFLTQELKNRGIPNPIIEKFWIENPLDENILAEKVILKKLLRLHTLPPFVQRQKIFNFLKSRGFNLETCRDVIDKYLLS